MLQPEDRAKFGSVGGSNRPCNGPGLEFFATRCVFVVLGVYAVTGGLSHKDQGDHNARFRSVARSSMRLFTHSLGRAFVRAFIGSFVRTFVQARPVRRIARSPVRSLARACPVAFVLASSKPPAQFQSSPPISLATAPGTAGFDRGYLRRKQQPQLGFVGARS